MVPPLDRLHRLLGSAARLSSVHRTITAAVLLIAVAGLAGVLRYAAPDETVHLALHAEPVLIEDPGSAADLTVTDADLAALMRAGGQALPATVVGRVLAPADSGPARTLHQWPGIYTSARFAGEALAIAFDDPFNRYRIRLDEGAGPSILVTRPGRRVLHLSGLGDGPHDIRIDKISEVQHGTSGLPTFVLPAGGEALAPPPPRSRQVEFVGDSDSVGYGNLSTTRDCLGADVFLLTDTQESFGPRVARHFDADYQLIAASGVRLTRDETAGDPDWTMLKLYPRAVFRDPSRFDPGDWSPGLVVLALGSNDFASPGPADQRDSPEAFRQEFEARYLAFLHDIRAAHPEAFLLFVAWEEYGPDYLAAHEAVLEALRARGESRADLIVLPEMEKTGCHWHPSLQDHRDVAQAIVDYIEDRPVPWIR